VSLSLLTTSFTRLELTNRSRTSADAPLPAASTSALVEQSEEATPPPPVVLPPKEKVPKINSSSLAELKNTCDDVVKEVRPAAAFE
jgi:hypothetical protein